MRIWRFRDLTGCDFCFRAYFNTCSIDSHQGLVLISSLEGIYTEVAEVLGTKLGSAFGCGKPDVSAWEGPLSWILPVKNEWTGPKDCIICYWLLWDLGAPVKKDFWIIKKKIDSKTNLRTLKGLSDFSWTRKWQGCVGGRVRPGCEAKRKSVIGSPESSIQGGGSQTPGGWECQMLTWAF